MEQERSAYHDDLIRLKELLSTGIELKWHHQQRKQILLLVHQLKNASRTAGDSEVEAELVAIESTLGFGSGAIREPQDYQVEEHQIRLLELAEPQKDLNLALPELEVSELALPELEVPIETDEIADPIEETSEEASEAAIEIQLILCNCPGRDVARELANDLVKKRLAAGVNIITNIGSIYWCQGEIKDTAECQLQIKTSSQRLSDVIDYIKQNHPDDVPEILASTVNEGNKGYFDWVKQETNV